MNDKIPDHVYKVGNLDWIFTALTSSITPVAKTAEARIASSISANRVAFVRQQEALGILL